MMLLVCGVILFVLPTLEKTGGTTNGGNKGPSGTMQDTIAGCLAQLAVVALSGFAAIYFEMAIKTTKGDAANVNMWGRNLQLSFYSIILYLFLRNFDEAGDGGGSAAAKGGLFGLGRPFFDGWSSFTAMITVSMACNRTLVALSIKYGDSILKTLAVSGSIVLASVADHVVLGGPLTVQMGIAGVVVIIAIINYAFDGTKITPAAAAAPATKGASSGAAILNGKPADDAIHTAKSDAWQDNEVEAIEMQPLMKGKEADNTSRRTKSSA